jgi:hypothetical protein
VEKTSGLALLPLHFRLLERLLLRSCLFLHHRVSFVVLFVVALARIVDCSSASVGKAATIVFASSCVCARGLEAN